MTNSDIPPTLESSKAKCQKDEGSIYVRYVLSLKCKMCLINKYMVPMYLTI